MGYRQYLILGLGSIVAFSAYADNKIRGEELIVVQTTSTDRQSFVIYKGLKDGISKGQEIIFGNENVSFVCKAVEVNRLYSLWKPVDKNMQIPFNKDDIVSYNSHAYGNVALDIVADYNNLTPTVNFNEIYKKFRSNNNYSTKVSYNSGLSQSSSDVSADKNSTRTGYAFAAEYNYRFMPVFEMSFGLRIDSENYRLKSPELDIPTNRALITVAMTYHLTSLSQNENNYYLSLGAGIGTSKTIINEAISSGYATILPEARFGYLKPLSTKMALIVEGSVESLNSNEKFSNGTQQTTNMINAKISIGLRF